MLQLGPSIRITADRHNVIVERLHTPRRARDGGAPHEPHWVASSFHRTVPQALRSIGEQLIRDCLDDDTIRDIRGLEAVVFDRLTAMTMDGGG